MGKSTNGPDWTDVVEAMREVGEFHNVDVSLTVQPSGEFGSAPITLVVVAVRKAPTFLGAKRSVSRKYHFPCAQSAALEGLAYRAVLECDLDCGAMWSQEELPLKA